MARVYAPSQRTSDGRWDYTISSDEEGWVHAAGYCSGGLPDMTLGQYVERYGPATGAWLHEQQAAVATLRHKFHRDGHATADEAAACYLEYELDRELRFWTDREEQRRCQVCDEWTGGRAEVGRDCGRLLVLCERHQSRENAGLAARRAPA